MVAVSSNRCLTAQIYGFLGLLPNLKGYKTFILTLINYSISKRNPLYDFPYGYDEGGLYESSVV